MPGPDLHKLVLDAIPDPIFVVDDDVRIIDCNKVAAGMLGENPELALRKRGGDALHCIRALGAPQGCGTSPACLDCAIRNSVRAAFQGEQTRRVRHKLQLVRGDHTVEAHMLVTTAPIRYAGDDLALLVLEDISELVALRRLLPMCAYCRRIRNDEQYWQDVESYFSRLDIDFSHGICPDCLHDLYPDVPDSMADNH